MNVLEDEYHFLHVCPKYRNLRQKFFKRYFCHWPNISNLKNLCQHIKKSIAYNVAEFIYYANNLRI